MRLARVLPAAVFVLTSACGAPATGRALASSGTAVQAGEDVSRERPLSLFGGRWGIVEVEVGGQVRRLVVDTGANRTLIDVGFARSMDLAVSGCATIPGALVGDLCHVSVPGLKVAGRTVDLKGAFAADMAHSELGETLEVIGLLGGDVLSRFVLVFDYPHARWALVEPNRWTPPQAEPIPIEVEGGAVTVPVVVAGHASRFVLDTGNAGRSIVLDVPGQESLAPPGAPLFPGGVRSGAGGSADGTMCRASLQVGSFTQRDAPLVVASKITRGTMMARTAGILGVGFLRYFRVTVDYPRKRLFLEQELPFEAGEASDVTYGVIARPARGALVVQSVAPGSPAAAAGLKVGDAIAGINGVSVGKNAPVLWPLVTAPSAGQSAELALADGRRVTLRPVAIPP